MSDLKKLIQDFKTRFRLEKTEYENHLFVIANAENKTMETLDEWEMVGLRKAIQDMNRFYQLHRERLAELERPLQEKLDEMESLRVMLEDHEARQDVDIDTDDPAKIKVEGIERGMIDAIVKKMDELMGEVETLLDQSAEEHMMVAEKEYKLSSKMHPYAKYLHACANMFQAMLKDEKKILKVLDKEMRRIDRGLNEAINLTMLPKKEEFDEDVKEAEKEVQEGIDAIDAAFDAITLKDFSGLHETSVVHKVHHDVEEFVEKLESDKMLLVETADGRMKRIDKDLYAAMKMLDQIEAILENFHTHVVNAQSSDGEEYRKAYERCKLMEHGIKHAFRVLHNCVVRAKKKEKEFDQHFKKLTNYKQHVEQHYVQKAKFEYQLVANMIKNITDKANERITHIQENLSRQMLFPQGAEVTKKLQDEQEELRKLVVHLNNIQQMVQGRATEVVHRLDKYDMI